MNKNNSQPGVFGSTQVLYSKWTGPAILGACLVLLLSPGTISGNENYLIQLRNGSAIQVQLPDQAIEWRRVARDGSVTNDIISLQEIREIKFALSPASEQVSHIRRLINGLQSDDYRSRCQSEEQLIAEGSPFLDIIRLAQQSENPEVRYRVERVLKRLNYKNAKKVNADFDRVFLSEASEYIEGDVGEWTLEFEFRGQAVTYDRKSLISIARLSDENGDEDVDQSDDPTINSYYHNDDYAKDFYQDGQQIIDFDQGKLGETFQKDEQITEKFVHQGGYFSTYCAHPSFPITSGFKIARGRSQGHSIASYMPDMNKKYTGTMRIDFCIPEQRNVPAAVHRVGLFVAVVTDPREIVLEAFNSDGHIVGISEASQTTSFVGVQSPFAISHVQCASNIHLDLPVDEIDSDYAIDDVCFDQPRLDITRPIDGKFTVFLKDGSRFACGNIFVDSDKVRVESTSGLSGDVEIDRNEIVGFTTQNELAVDDEGLLAMLRDQSIIRVNYQGGKFVSVDFDGLSFERKDLVALWGAKSTLRYPFTVDFEQNKPIVVVKPTHRVLLEELDINDSGLAWDPESATIQEQWKSDDGEESVSPIGKSTEYSFDEAPSVWFEMPKPLTHQDAIVRLTNGSRFVTNGKVGFELAEFNAEKITIKVNDQDLEVPISKVRSIQFPR